MQGSALARIWLVILVSAVVSLGACNKVRPLAVSDTASPDDTTDESTDQTTDDSTCEQFLTGTIDGSDIFSGSMGPGDSNFEIGTATDAGTSSSHHSTGPEDLWKVVREGTPKITVAMLDYSPIPSDCTMSFYLFNQCEEDPSMVCESEDAICLGDGLVLASGYSVGQTSSISYAANTPDLDLWLFFDTDAGCQGSYEFSVTYEDWSPD